MRTRLKATGTTTIKSALLCRACLSLSGCAGGLTAGERIADMPHWMGARQAVNHAGSSEANEIQAWRNFRAAAAAEGWLVE
jgi:hypothetical protein